MARSILHRLIHKALIAGALLCPFGGTTASAQTYGSPQYQAVGIGVAAPPSGLAAITTLTSQPSPFNLITSTLNLGYSGGTVVGLGNVNVVLNDNGTSGVGPTASVGAASFTVNIADINPPSGPGEDFPLHPSCLKSNPAGFGSPSVLRGCETLWSLAYGPNNEFLSQSGINVIYEADWNSNGVDDRGDYPAWEFVIGSGAGSNSGTAVASGGWPTFVQTGTYYATSNEPADVWVGDAELVGLNFGHSLLDLQHGVAAAPAITSATPGGTVTSVTVNNVMPLAGGDFAFNGGGQLGSTFGQITTATSAVSGSTTVPVASTAYLKVNQLIHDLTTPANTSTGSRYITAIGTNQVTVSSAITLGSGDQLMFTNGTKAVTINGNAYTVVGVALTAGGSLAGTVYFIGPVTVADATNGNLIYPNSHEVWLCNGSATAPWCDIAFNTTGSVSIRGDGSNGIAVQGTQIALPPITSPTVNGPMTAKGGPQWSANNYAQTLIVQGNGRNTAIGMLDASGANPFAITDDGASGISFLAMPAPGNTTTTPTLLAHIGPTGGVQLPKSVVASLPACAAGNEGLMFAVTDAASPAYAAPLTGGGSSHVIAYCTGSGWTAH